MVAHAQMGGRGTLGTGEPSEYDTGTPTQSKSLSSAPPKKKNWRTLVVNINGLRDKKAAMQSACDYLQPDVIIGCETKITNNTFTSEVLPPQYVANTYRKDRTSHGGGGVLMAIRDGYVVNKVDIDTDSEQVWARVELPGEKPFHICSFTDHLVVV